MIYLFSTERVNVSAETIYMYILTKASLHIPRMLTQTETFSVFSSAQRNNLSHNFRRLSHKNESFTDSIIM